MSSQTVNPHDDPQGPGDARPTADQIVDQLGVNRDSYRNKVVLITGASDGIGVETARTFAKLGCQLFLPVRNMQKGTNAVKDIEASTGITGKIHLLQMDLSSLQSVRDCVKEFLSQSQQLNILICNAGVMACPEGTTVDGFETQFGTNHLGHFLLVKLLLPTLISSSSPALASRVIALSSTGHTFTPILFDDYNLKKIGYNRWLAYGQSKTANIYMANEIERRYGGQGVHALSLHPGSISTGLQSHVQEQPMSEEELKLMGLTPEQLKARRNTSAKSVQQGAATTVWAALNPAFENKGGYYCEDCSVAKPRSTALLPGQKWSGKGHAEWVYDEESAKRLWDESERMIEEAAQRKQ